MKFRILIKNCLILGLMLLPSACFRTSYKLTKESGKTFHTEYWNNYFIFGLVPVKQKYKYIELCRLGQVARVNSSVDPLNVIADIFSLGLSSSNTVSTQCLEKPIAVPVAVKPSVAKNSKSVKSTAEATNSKK